MTKAGGSRARRHEYERGAASGEPLAPSPAWRIRAAIERNPKIRDVALGLVRALGLAAAAAEVEFLAENVR